MKLKKLAGALVACAFAGTIFAGCGGNSTPEPEIEIGMIKTLNVSEKLYEETIEKLEAELSDGKLIDHRYNFYDSLTLLEMGLESGSIKEASTYDCVGKYLMAHNSAFEVLPEHNPLKLADNFVFAMRANDSALMTSVNEALSSMKTAGILDDLAKTYITDLKADEEPPAVAFEVFAGADTIKVGVTGDLPPLDLILPDGKAAGFNTALLSELGKHLQKNIELVQIDSASRAAALTSGKIDIAFWAILPVNKDVPPDIDKPNGIELSEPYFTDEIVHVAKRQ